METFEINKIYNENCLETMKERIRSESIDLTITSPPYDDLRDYKGFVFNFIYIAELLYRVTKPGGVVVWVVGDQTKDGTESGTSFSQALTFKRLGFNLFDTMIYQKSSFSFPANDRYHQVFEYMFIFSKGKPKTFNPIFDRPNIETRIGGDAKRQKNGTVKKGNRVGQKLARYGKRFNIWRYQVGGGLISSDPIVHKHPAAFPEQLAKDHIISWSNENDLIYDPFIGSGTTAAAAVKMGRRFIGSEISAEYCEIANQRIQNAIDSQGLFNLQNNKGA